MPPDVEPQSVANGDEDDAVDTMRTEWISQISVIFLKIIGRRFFDFSAILAEKLAQGPL